MPVEVTAGVMVGTLSEDMLRPAMLRVDTLVFVLAPDGVTSLRGPHADKRALQGAHLIGMAAVTGEAVNGEAITGIRPLDIRWAITAWATAIHPTGLAITVIPTVDTILTATDTGRP